MDRAGEKLKRVRERLKLTYRDVEQASQKIAGNRASDEFAIALSRLADIENKGTVPTIYRLYTLCAIYRLDFDEVLRWYGVPRDQIAAEGMQIALDETHLLQFTQSSPVTVPHPIDCEIDLQKTTFLSHLIRRWGKLPLSFLSGLDLGQHRFGFIGMDDWSMYPILHPGSLVMIDENRRRIATGGWTNELERPIYFLEHRDRFLCGWCTLMGNNLWIQPHPASQEKPSVFEYQKEIDVVGQVTGIAMILEPKRQRTAPASKRANKAGNA
jgi:transcriptional regulator with XRE-family HTH domain